MPRIENGAVVAIHPPLEGRDQTRLDPAHRQASASSRQRLSDDAPVIIRRAGDQVARVEDLDGARHLKGDHGLLDAVATVRRLERGEMTALEAIDALLAEEFTLRENRRIKTALVRARLSTIKTLAGFDFSFQPRSTRTASWRSPSSSSSTGLRSCISSVRPALARVT
jgi:hypothetical protein